MTRKILSLCVIFIVFTSFLIGCSGGFSTKLSGGKGTMSKTFGFTNTKEKKTIEIVKESVLEVTVKSDMKEGSVTVRIFDATDKSELLKLEDRKLDEKRELNLAPGNYTLEVIANDAKRGKYTVTYNIK